MAAPKGNKFYKKRAKDGRELIYKDPSELLEASYEYFDWCNKNPVKREEVIKGGILAGTTVKVNITRPYTLGGLCIHIGIGKRTFDGYCEREDFVPITTHIREIIQQNQIEGAMSGTYKENIVARLLGLAEKREVDIPNGLHIEVTSPATKKAIEKLQGKLQTE